ncbi:unnamed protein product [Tilletia laevis]|uniref:Uncharacterized protein n=1 Tax=Tilletia laevis TaxID=157183 RepID=A0A9N8Q8D1_9BASI|nr:unnamed protein product [Tilletia laevis]CAD7060319.1 unnamed protein product [Tilletia caries]
MVTRREEALGAVKLYPGEPYVGDASVAASPSLQWTGSDSEFVDSDLLVLFRNVASLVPVAGPILAPALAYVKDIVICVKTVKDNQRRAESLATDVLSHAQGLLQTAKDADIRLLPGTPVANIVIRLEVRLKVILQDIRICQDPFANKFSKAFEQFVKRDDIAAILSVGREQLKLSMAAFSNEPLLSMAVPAQSHLSRTKRLPFFEKQAKEEAALPFRILEAELEHHSTVGAAHAPDPNTRDKVAADVDILHLLQQMAGKLKLEMVTLNDDDSARTTALELSKMVIESQQTGEDAQDRFESIKQLFALGTCLMQLAMYSEALPVWTLAASNSRQSSANQASPQLLLGFILFALSKSYYMVSRIDEALDAVEECVDILGKADVRDAVVAASLNTARDFKETLEKASNDAAQGIPGPTRHSAPSGFFTYQPGDSARAVLSSEKRVELYERLHGLDASRWRPDYAKALSDHAGYLLEWAERCDSATAAQVREKRVGVYERLHGLDAPRWLLNYVAELSDFAKYLSKSDQPGDYERAMQLHDKRVKLFKPLVALGKFRWNYVEALLDHVKYLVKSDRPGDSARAVQISEGAIELFKQLYEEEASRWRPYYAEALSNHAGYLSKWGDPGDSARAVQFSEKGIELYKQLHTDDASKWQSDYAEALSDHAGYLLEWAERCDSATAAQVREKRVGVYERLHGLDASRWRPDYAKALSNHAGYLSKSGQPGGFARAVQASQRRVELFKEDVVQWKKPYEDAQESHASYLRIFEELKSPYPAIRYILSPVSISFKHLVVTLKRTNEQTRQLAEELEQTIRKVIVDLVANVEVSDNVHSVDSEFNVIAQKLDSDLVRILKDISPDSQRWRFLAPWKTTKTVLARAKEEFAVLYSNLCARPNVPGHVQPTLDLNRFSHYPDLGDLLKACNSSIPFVAATIRPVLISLDGILISVQDSKDDDVRRQGAALAVEILKPVKGFVDLFNGGDFIRSPDFAFAEAMRKLGDDLFELRSDMCTRQRASGHWWRIFVARKSVESLLVSGHKAFMANTKQAEMDVLYERYAGQPRPTPEDASPNPPAVDMSSIPVP